MPSDPLPTLEEMDIESIQIFCEENSMVRTLCKLDQAMRFFYRQGYLKHDDRPTQLKNVVRGNIRQLERNFGWGMDEIIEILTVVDEMVEDLGSPHKVIASTISMTIRTILEKYQVSKPRAPFVKKRLRFED